MGNLPVIELAVARLCVEQLARESGSKVSPEQVQHLCQCFARAAWRFAMTSPMSSSATAGKFLTALKEMSKNLDGAFAHAWAINSIVEPSLSLNGETADYSTDSQKLIAAEASTFLRSPEFEANCPMGLIETLIALRAACENRIAELERSGWSASVRTARGYEKTKQHSERRRYILTLADIYEIVTGCRATANDGGSDDSNYRDPFTRFLAEGWKLAGNNHPPQATAIKTILQSRDSNERFVI